MANNNQNSLGIIYYATEFNIERKNKLEEMKKFSVKTFEEFTTKIYEIIKNIELDFDNGSSIRSIITKECRHGVNLLSEIKPEYTIITKKFDKNLDISDYIAIDTLFQDFAGLWYSIKHKYDYGNELLCIDEEHEDFWNKGIEFYVSRKCYQLLKNKIDKTVDCQLLLIEKLIEFEKHPFDYVELEDFLYKTYSIRITGVPNINIKEKINTEILDSISVFSFLLPLKEFDSFICRLFELFKYNYKRGIMSINSYILYRLYGILSKAYCNSKFCYHKENIDDFKWFYENSFSYSNLKEYTANQIAFSTIFNFSKCLESITKNQLFYNWFERGEYEKNSYKTTSNIPRESKLGSMVYSKKNKGTYLTIFSYFDIDFFLENPIDFIDLGRYYVNKSSAFDILRDNRLSDETKFVLINIFLCMMNGSYIMRYVGEYIVILSSIITEEEYEIIHYSGFMKEIINIAYKNAKVHQFASFLFIKKNKSLPCFKERNKYLDSFIQDCFYSFIGLFFSLKDKDKNTLLKHIYLREAKIKSYKTVNSFSLVNIGDKIDFYLDFVDKCSNTPYENLAKTVIFESKMKN